MITNTRETGKLEVSKDLEPEHRPGGCSTCRSTAHDEDATNVGDGGTTGEQTLNTGDHTVGETAGTGTDLADYAKSIVCKDDNGSGAVVATGSTLARSTSRSTRTTTSSARSPTPATPDS